MKFCLSLFALMVLLLTTKVIITVLLCKDVWTCVPRQVLCNISSVTDTYFRWPIDYDILTQNKTKL